MKFKLQYQCNYIESATLTPCNFLAVGVRIVGALQRLPFCNNYYLLWLWKSEMTILNYFLYIWILCIRTRETRRRDKRKKTGYRSYVVVQAGINEAHALTTMQNVICLIFTEVSLKHVSSKYSSINVILLFLPVRGKSCWCWC